MTTTREDLIQNLLRPIAQAIKENPARTNGGACRYIVEGQPNCVAAVAFVANGVTTEYLADWEGSSAYAVAKRAFDLSDNGDDELPGDILSQFQRAADRTVHFDDGSERAGVTPWAEVWEIAREKILDMDDYEIPTLDDALAALD